MRREVTSIIALVALLPIFWFPRQGHALGEVLIKLRPDSLLHEIPPGTAGGALCVFTHDSLWRDPTFQQDLLSLRKAGFRWPWGSRGNAYDWREHTVFGEGTDWQSVDAPHLIRILRELEDRSGLSIPISLKVPFGVCDAADAADLADYLLAPAGASQLAQERDSLLALLGVEPGPIEVSLMEIGTEIYGYWEWPWSWTCEDAEKYFMGGDQLRWYDAGHSHGIDMPDTLGCGQVPVDGLVEVRFPPLAPDGADLRVALWEADLQQYILVLDEELARVEDLSGYGPEDPVYVVLADSSGVRVPAGFQPPDPLHFLLVEYRSVGHDGAIAFADSIRERLDELSLTAPPIAFCHPPYDKNPEFAQYVEDHIEQIAAGLDCRVDHHYHINPPRVNHAWALGDVDVSRAAWDEIEGWCGQYGLSWGITEWNYKCLGHLLDNPGYTGPGSAAFTARYLAELGCAAGLDNFLGAWHFRTAVYGAANLLALYVYDSEDPSQFVAETRGTGFRLAGEMLDGRAVPLSIERDTVTAYSYDYYSGLPDSCYGLPEAFAYASLKEDSLSLLLITARDDSTLDLRIETGCTIREVELELCSPVDTTVAAQLLCAEGSLVEGWSFNLELPARSLALLKGRLDPAGPLPPVDDLGIRLEGGEAVLSWSGIPCAEYYDVYHSESPFDVAGQGTLLDSALIPEYHIPLPGSPARAFFEVVARHSR